MSWDNLASDILEDFASFNNPRHERIAEYWNYHRERIREYHATFRAKLKCDTVRKAHYAALRRRRAQMPAAREKKRVYDRTVRAGRGAQYYQQHREIIAIKRADPVARAKQKAYDRARYLRIRAQGRDQKAA